MPCKKCEELALLRDALNSGDTAAITDWSAPIQARRHSTRGITRRWKNVWRPSLPGTASATARMKCAPKPSVRALTCRVADHNHRLSRRLPRSAACAWTLKKGNLDANHYRTGIAEHIKQAIVEQERLGLDVLVRGEAEA